MSGLGMIRRLVSCSKTILICYGESAARKWEMSVVSFDFSRNLDVIVQCALLKPSPWHPKHSLCHVPLSHFLCISSWELSLCIIWETPPCGSFLKSVCRRCLFTAARITYCCVCLGTNHLRNQSLATVFNKHFSSYSCSSLEKIHQK